MGPLSNPMTDWQRSFDHQSYEFLGRGLDSYGLLEFVLLTFEDPMSRTIVIVMTDAYHYPFQKQKWRRSARVICLLNSWLSNRSPVGTFLVSFSQGLPSRNCRLGVAAMEVDYRWCLSFRSQR